MAEVLGTFEQAVLLAIIRLADKAGVPMFHVQAVKDGHVADALLNGNDILSLGQTQRKEDKAASDKVKADLGNGFVQPESTTAARIAHLPNIVGKPTR